MKQKNFLMRFRLKWSIAIKIVPLALTVTLLKFIAHSYGWEVMELNALFTSLVAGTIFLIGFLISYMFLLIKDLDDPFDYVTNGEGGTEVSLKPIHDLEAEYDVQMNLKE